MQNTDKRFKKSKKRKDTQILNESLSMLLAYNH